MLYLLHNLILQLQKIFEKLQQVTFNHLSDKSFDEFMKIYKQYTNIPYWFLVNDISFSSDNHLLFRKLLVKNLFTFTYKKK